jgi:hypothetical protein
MPAKHATPNKILTCPQCILLSHEILNVCCLAQMAARRFDARQATAGRTLVQIRLQSRRRRHHRRRSARQGLRREFGSPPKSAEAASRVYLWPRVQCAVNAKGNGQNTDQISGRWPMNKKFMFVALGYLLLLAALGFALDASIVAMIVHS